MAKPVSFKGKPDSLVSIQFMAPLWMKKRAYEAAQTLGKGYSDFLKDAIRDTTDVVLARADRRRDQGSGKTG